MRIFWRITFFITLLIFPAVSQAQILTSAAGTGLSAMNLPAGAKATALGGAFSSWADDSSAIYWNPAGLAWLPEIQIQTAYNQWFQDTFFQDLGLAWPTDWGALGARFSYINLGGVVGRDVFGNTNGSFYTPEDLGGTVAIAGKLGRLSLGLSAKFYEEFLPSYTYDALGIDVGSLYRSGDWSLSLGVHNIGLASTYGFSTEYYSGTSLVFGLDNFLLHIATDAIVTSGDLGLHHGIELSFQKSVFLRAGYQWFPQPLQNQDQAGLSGGVGIALSNFQLDYSIVSYMALGTTNQVSISYQFALSKPASEISGKNNSSSNEDSETAVHGGSFRSGQ